MDNIKERTRERMELRMHADETVRLAIQWMETVKPSQWLPSGKDSVIGDDEVKRVWRDHVDKAQELITKLWQPVNLLVDDMTFYLEEMCAKPKSPPQSQ